MSVIAILWICANYTSLEENKLVWWVVGVTGIYYGMLPVFKWSER